LQAEIGNYQELGYQVYAVAQDSPEINKTVMAKNKLSFPILSDADMTASIAFGLVFKIDDKTKAAYKGFGLDLEALYGRAQPLMLVPAVYIIDSTGKVRFNYVNPDYRERCPTEILKAAMAVYR
jgi:peroxiredoxin